jgi:restriction endonuclease S subunit
VLFNSLSNYQCKSLGELVSVKKSIEPGSDCYGEVGVSFVRVSDVSTMGISDPPIKIPQNIVPKIESLYPQKDTILFSKDGTVGVAYKVEKDLNIVTSGALLHLNIKNKSIILPDYLTLVLNSDIVKLQAERDAGGSIIQHWKPKDIANVVIPILPYEKQIVISKSVQESFALRHEAQRLLDVAIRAVEIAIETNESNAIEYIHANTNV